MKNYQFFKSMKFYLSFLLIIVCSCSLKAQVIKSFAQRSASATPSTLIYNIKGDYTMIGNTNLTLQSYGPNTNNSNNFMEYVDVDSDPNTLNSSSATLELSTENGAIPECSNILFAGLYWTGRASNSSSSPETFSVTKGSVTKNYNKRIVSLKGPGQANYTDFEANPGNIYYPDGSYGNMYSAFVEVTDYVETNGIGEYTVADMALIEGNGGGTGYYGGWGMIVVYENSQMDWRDVTIFDGHAYVVGGSTVNFELPVSGFNTAQSGAINMKLGLMAGEGDVNISGDYFKIRNWQDNAWIPLSHSGNSTTNFFNGSVNTGGNPRDLNLQNNTGLDIAMFDVPNPGNSVVTNSQTSTRFQYGSTQDTYTIFCIAMSVDAYIPDVESVVSTETINGIPVGGGTLTVLPGEDIEYKVQIKNQGTEAVNDAYFVIPLPYTTSFVPGSIVTQINFTPSPLPNNAYYDPLMGPTGSIVWDFGTLPMPPVGFPDSVLAELSYHLEVTTDCNVLTNPDCPPQVILTGGNTTGTGAISGATFDMPFIQGYEIAGTCIGEPINEPLVIEIDADQYIQDNCQNTPSTRLFTFCNYNETTIPVDSVAIDFPAGLSFYNTNNITPSSIEYDENNPFPATPGTSTYFAIPDGINFCYYTFTITVQSPIITFTTQTDEVDCVGESDGAIDLTILGGIPPYSYSWTGPSSFTSSTEDIASLVEGTYDVVISDSLGCTAEATENVTTVVDVSDPTIMCPIDISVGNDFGVCGGIVNYIEPLGIDECPGSITTMIQGLATGQTFPIGTTLVEYNVIDMVGNSANCSFNVTVNDVEVPSIACPADINTTPDASSCVATGLALGTPTTGDNCGVANVVNDAPVSYPPGSTTVTWTVTDVNGNTNTCEQVVNITDAENPTIICPSPVIIAADAGVCEATGVSLGVPSTADNCGVVSVTSDAPTSFPVGITNVTWTVMDAAGNMATCVQTVTVTDDEDPIIACPGDVTVSNDLGNCSTIATNVSLGNPTTSDNCGNVTVTNNAPGLFLVGNTTVTWIATDDYGNTSTCSQIVTVLDNENPVVTVCAAAVTESADPSICGATSVFLGVPTVTDNCGIASTTNDAPALFPVGLTVVTWTITDIHGNDITCSQDVTITDDEDPTVTCPGLITVSADPEVCFATGVSLGTPTTNDNCGVATITNNAPVSFSVGTTTVTWTITDNAGNSSTCTQDVVVTDNELPQITCSGNVTVTNDLGDCSTDSINVVLEGPIVYDNCGIDTVYNDAPAVFAGITNVTWTVVDIHGNSAVCIQTVTIEDNENPVVVSCAAPITITADPNICGATGVNLGTPTVSDNCGIATTVNDAPALFPVGITTVTWTITDINSNVVSCEQEVTVTDDEAPAINCPPTVVVSQDVNFCYATNVNLGTPTTSDNCGVATLTNDAPSIFPVGTTVVMWVVTDVHQNTDTCYQDVTVTDDEAPILSNCPTDTSTCDPVVYYQAPTATDNCGISSIVQVAGYGPGATFPVGTTTEVWEITDIHGNIAFCSFNITIHPKPIPSLSALNVSCFEFGDGQMGVNMLDGTAPYQYLWSNGDTLNVADSLDPGEYTVVVTDANGCVGEQNGMISQPEILNASETHENASCNGVSDGAIDVTVTGGTVPYQYNWSNGAISQDLVAIQGGIYSDTIHDFNGCEYIIEVEINEPDSIVATGTVVDAICEGANGGIDLTVTGGSEPYQYSWSNGDTLQDIDSISLGTYSVIVTDTKGCTTSFQEVVGSYSVMTIGRDIYHPRCYGEFGSIEITVSDGAEPYSFEWSNGDTTQILTGATAGYYSVTVTDANMCSESVAYEVTQPDSLGLDLISSEYEGGFGVSGYNQEDGTIDLTIYGGTNPYSITWNPRGDGESLVDLPAGTYYVTVTDINGCTVTDSTVLTEPLDLEIPTGFTPNNDGYNDFFVIRGIEAFPDNELIIYNRWGNIVYNKEGYANEWDGINNNGERLPDGTYFVVFQINAGNLPTINIANPYSGYIDLRRTR